MLLQKSPSDRFQKLLVVTHSRQPLQLFMIRIALAGLLFDNGGIQFFLRLEVAKMIASFTSASVAKSRVVVPLNPFFPNNSIAVAMICCRRSCFISKFLLTLL